MTRIAPPLGYTSWNQYIEDQADASPDQSIDARRLIKRNIKLGMIAPVERAANRPNHTYNSPGTVAPAPHHPWE
jgi:hypothetical protein